MFTWLFLEQMFLEQMFLEQMFLEQMFLEQMLFLRNRQMHRFTRDWGGRTLRSSKGHFLS
jgi:hypothetical protein